MRNPFRRSPKSPAYLANDGQWYTQEQYQEAARLVTAHLEGLGRRVERLSHLHVTGAVWAITDDGRRFEYYMRDLVQGIVREDGYEDYAAAVRAAGIV